MEGYHRNQKLFTRTRNFLPQPETIYSTAIVNIAFHYIPLFKYQIVKLNYVILIKRRYITFDYIFLYVIILDYIRLSYIICNAVSGAITLSCNELLHVMTVRQRLTRTGNSGKALHAMMVK